MLKEEWRTTAAWAPQALNASEGREYPETAAPQWDIIVILSSLAFMKASSAFFLSETQREVPRPWCEHEHTVHTLLHEKIYIIGYRTVLIFVPSADMGVSGATPTPLKVHRINPPSASLRAASSMSGVSAPVPFSPSAPH